MHMTPSPTALHEGDKSHHAIISNNGLEFSLPEHFHWTTPQSARSNYSIPVNHDKVFYYEMTVVNQGDNQKIGLGFCTKDVALDRMPGWENNAWGYHGDDGSKFAEHGHGSKYGPLYGNGDVIGCGLDFKRGFSFFTKNGGYLGPAFPLREKLRLYAVVGMRSAGAKVRLNFGQEKFLWNNCFLEDDPEDDELLGVPGVGRRRP